MSHPSRVNSAIKSELLCQHCQKSLRAAAKFCGYCGKRVIKDFFISYNKADKAWAEWIAWQLEAAGYTTIIQAWDFQAGNNFMVEMDEATKTTHHTLAILSPEYLKSGYTRLEWTAALARDPTSSQRPVISVRVRDLGETFSGLLLVIGYLDLLGLGEDVARERLLARASGQRGKPTVAPAFPGLAQQEAAPQPPVFPGPNRQAAQPPQRPWLVPHRRNPYFTGRDDTLEQLHATFAAKPGIITQAITGLGGIGKTQTALEYIYRYEQDYQAIFWVQAETRELLIGDFGKMAALLLLPERNEPEQAIMVAAVTRWLEAHSGWLLVLDNVEDVTQAREVLPVQGQGHMLLTMRAAAPSGFPQRAPLEPLPPSEATRFLLHRASLNPEDAAQQAQAHALAEALGSLPLALDQAGAYIDETRCGLKAYLELYQQRRTALLSHRGENVTDHPDSVAVTWAVAFEKLENDTPAAADLLRLCAFLHPEAIPEDLFRAGAKELTPALQQAINDPIQWNAALAALRRFSLIERQAETQTLNVHRLVQAVLHDAMIDDERRAWAEYVVLLVAAAFPNPGKFANWERCQQLLPHALICTIHIEQWHLTSEGVVRLLSRAAYYLDDRAQYVEALLLYQRALAIDEQTLGVAHPDVAIDLNNLALVYRNQGHYAEALPLLQRGLAIREQTLEPNHPDIASSLNNLADFYLMQGQYEEALPLLQRARMILEQSLEANNPLLATCLNNLAELYREQGRYGEALPLYQQALAMDEQVLGPIHPDVAFKLNNLALLHYAQEQYEEALPLFERALAIDEQALGPTHPIVATIMSNLAALYFAKERYEEALTLFERALVIREQTLEPIHPDIAYSLNNLAELYRQQRQYAAALPLYQRARVVWEQSLGPTHPLVATSLSNMAALYYTQGRYKEALPLFERALAILEQALPDHPNTVACLESLAILSREMGQEAQAREYNARSQAIRTRRKAAGM